MEQIKLPIKTEIAACWLIITGLIFWLRMIMGGASEIIFSIGLFFNLKEFSGITLLSLCPLLFLPLPFLGYDILQTRRRAWQRAQILLYMGILLLILSSLSVLKNAIGNLFDPQFQHLSFLILIYTIIIIVPLTLLLIDRKNFLKITSLKI